MVWMLTEEEVVQHWELIKWGAYQVNKPPDPGKYFIGLLKEIYIGTAQVWFMSNGERIIKAMGITKIIANIAGLKVLLLDTLYGYGKLNLPEVQSGFESLIKFAKSQKISTITAYASQPGIGALAQRAGMNKINEVYQMNIGAS